MAKQPMTEERRKGIVIRNLWILLALAVAWVLLMKKVILVTPDIPVKKTVPVEVLDEGMRKGRLKQGYKE